MNAPQRGRSWQSTQQCPASRAFFEPTSWPKMSLSCGSSVWQTSGSGGGGGGSAVAISFCCDAPFSCSAAPPPPFACASAPRPCCFFSIAAPPCDSAAAGEGGRPGRGPRPLTAGHVRYMTASEPRKARNAIEQHTLRGSPIFPRRARGGGAPAPAPLGRRPRFGGASHGLPAHVCPPSREQPTAWCGGAGPHGTHSARLAPAQHGLRLLRFSPCPPSVGLAGQDPPRQCR